jgi:2-C-methyl-D-erythritol 4-phosphate cytidylyltransferase
LKRAFGEAEADGFQGTDESSIVERAGIQVAVVMGTYENLKITHADDLDLAEYYLEKQSVPRA